ncbi:rhomboid family intramembrane serine protease [Thermodesulfobacteriota bacterium]
MIPIRDTIQSRNYPIVNLSIIGINVLLYLVEMTQGPHLNRFIYLYGLVPERYSNPEVAAYFGFGRQVFALFSFMFIHGGFWHLLGNMWCLYIFGDNVEDRLGHLRYIIFYLLCGWASGLSHLFINWNSGIPTIGASGAIAGVMGAYLILYPRARILTLIPIFFLPYFIEIPAFFFLGFWFFIQFLSAAGSHGQAGGVAWWAHIGGFISGIIFLQFFRKVPELGITERLRRVSPQRKTPHLQVIRTQGTAESPHLSGQIDITPSEAEFGTRKLANIPWGFNKRLVKITIPPGIKNGDTLSLSGMGRQISKNEKGDLQLKVLIQPRRH